MENYFFGDTGSTAVNPLFIGWEACESGHSFGPYVRDSYLIHFCIKGRGILKNSAGEFSVSSGSFFVIRPGEVTTYTADKDDPWEYTWVAFKAKNEAYFCSPVSVFKTPDGLDDKMLHLIEKESKSTEECLAIIYSLLSSTLDNSQNTETDDTVRQIKRYIKFNYMMPLSVCELAKKFGFERSYLYRIFKARYGIGIKEYITSVRMKMGRKFLSEGYSVKESAQMTGYEDRFSFSRTYSAYFGESPSMTKHSNKTQSNDE